MRTALDHPGRVRSLSLICSAGLGAEISSAYTDGFVATSSRRDLKAVLEELADPGLVSRQLVDDVLKYKRSTASGRRCRRWRPTSSPAVVRARSSR